MSIQKINLQAIVDGYLVALIDKCKVSTINGVEYADQYKASVQMQNYAVALASDFCYDAADHGHLNWVAEHQESIGFMLANSQQDIREMFDVAGKPELERAARTNLRVELVLNDLGWLEVTW